MAIERNAPGQHHNDVYVTPSPDWVPLRHPTGEWTGQFVTRDQLIYTDGRGINGRLRLDYHEVIQGNDGRLLVFHRGGSGYLDAQQTKYGHVRVSDLAGSIGRPVASGDQRGDPVSGGTLYRLTVAAVPRTMLYKTRVGSMYATYGNPGTLWGGDINYTFLVWSWLNVSGGGMVRGLLPDGCYVRRCEGVSSIRVRSMDLTGQTNGDIIAVYVKAQNLYGWILWAHQPDGEDYVPHVARV